jgi:AraC-like DNA-binding protein
MKEIAKDSKSKILKEQFIPDIVFMYVVNGAISFFDGNKNYTYKPGECGIVRKNRLLKFSIEDNQDIFEPIIFCFEEEFLRSFQKKHKTNTSAFKSNDAIIKISKTDLIKDFIQSLKPYYKGVMELDEAFEDLKYEELLIILLKNEPELAGIFFNYDIPGKLDLEAFMNRNYKFNVSNERFAHLTGRSISSFKREFKTIFNDTPSNWLVKKRLQDAYFLIDKHSKNPSDIYLELGFEDLSHFSFAFKKLYGKNPTDFTPKKKTRS